jgi:hypothetical protein
MSRLSAPVKSALSNARKWRIKEGSLAQWFYLVVEDTKDNHDLIGWLRKVRPEGFVYFNPGGTVKRRQWCLPMGECAAIWRAAGIEVKD